MDEKEKVVFSWSGGKDSALALYELLRDERYEVVTLLTTVAEQYQRVSHHGVREELLHLQAQSIGIPLRILYLPTFASHACTNSQYEELMGSLMQEFVDQGVRWVAHGDIFLEDLRKYREENLAKVGLQGLFPLWKRDTTQLVKDFYELGFRARLSCVDGRRLGKEFVGRSLDLDLMADLPEEVDPCGENGEYHSFVYDGPIFRWRVFFDLGQIVDRDVRYYIDMIPSAYGANQAEPVPANIGPI